MNPSFPVETQRNILRYWQYNHYAMTTINQEHQILEALETLDYFQKQKVMDFIKAITYPTAEEVRKQQMKREAMKEIRLALGNRRTK